MHFLWALSPDLLLPHYVGCFVLFEELVFGVLVAVAAVAAAEGGVLPLLLLFVHPHPMLVV